MSASPRPRAPDVRANQVITGLLRAPLPALVRLREAIDRVVKMAEDDLAAAVSAAIEGQPSGMAH